MHPLTPFFNVAESIQLVEVQKKIHLDFNFEIGGGGGLHDLLVLGQAIEEPSKVTTAFFSFYGQMVSF